MYVFFGYLVYVFNGYLVYFRATWYVLEPFGTFFSFGIWQPWKRSESHFGRLAETGGLQGVDGTLARGKKEFWKRLVGHKKTLGSML
jgi:hypothetical protein